MERKNLLIAVLLVIAGSFFACEKEIDKVITMKVSPNVIILEDTMSINLNIENHTNKRFSYGHGCSLEYFYNGNWIQTQFNMWIITYELLHLPSKGKVGHSYHVYFDKPGRYRIIKKFDAYYHTRREYVVYAEVEIK
jgi:hypothetical protein